MPELPEVETICRALRPHLLGERVVSVAAQVETLRLPVDVPAIERRAVGREIIDVRRRAKFLVVELASAQALVFHLGMTGAFRICAGSEPLRTHDRLQLGLSSGRSWRLEAIRRFSSVEALELPAPGAAPASLAKLGPEPFDDGLTPQALYAQTRGRSRPVKNLLLDQSVIAGIGNIYASEALFRARIRPTRASGALSRRDCGRLLDGVRDTLRLAIRAGGTTISDFRSVDGEEGKFQQALQVYGRGSEPCLHCGSSIERIVQVGRSTFYCPRCQR